MRPGQFVGRGANVHVGVVEHEVVEVDQLAVQPQAGSGVAEVAAGDKTGADRAFGEPFVEPGEGILGGGERPGEFCPRQRIGNLGARLQSLDNLRSEEHTSELQSRQYLVCRLLLEKKKNTTEFARHQIGITCGCVTECASAAEGSSS